MKVQIVKIQVSRDEVEYHLALASTGALLQGGGWKTERGARAKAKKLGAEIIN